MIKIIEKASDVRLYQIMIATAPKLVDLPADGDEDFGDMPGLAELAFSALEPSAETGTELQTPVANRFVRYLNTPLGKEIFNISQAQVESMIKPGRVADDFGRKPVMMISRCAPAHPFSVPDIG